MCVCRRAVAFSSNNSVPILIIQSIKIDWNFNAKIVFVALIGAIFVGIISIVLQQPDNACKPHKDAKSAISRATSPQCKRSLHEIACRTDLYPTYLPNYCHDYQVDLASSAYLGCYKDAFKARILNGSKVKLEGTNSPETCLRYCLEAGYVLAGVQYTSECFCGNEQKGNCKSGE